MLMHQHCSLQQAGQQDRNITGNLYLDDHTVKSLACVAIIGIVAKQSEMAQAPKRTYIWRQASS
jgi:virulence-associated protein VapD